MQENTTRHPIFDLDGTLIDSAPGIINGVCHALKAFGISPPGDLRCLECFIGPPLAESFALHYNMSAVQSRLALEHFRSYYRDFGIFENKPYLGIEELLSALADARRIVSVATSKPEIFAKQILERLKLGQYFFAVAGTVDDSMPKKSDVLRRLLPTLGCEPDELVMVGDRKYDVLVAREVGMDCIGVLYGYGTRQELEQAGAAQIVSSVGQLKKLLI